MKRLLLAALGSAWAAVALAQAPPPARAVDADYYRRLEERERANQLQLQKYHLSLSRFDVTPGAQATPYQDIVVQLGIVAGALGPGLCPDAAGVTWGRDGNTFRVRYPVAACANPLATAATPAQVNVGRLAPGDYRFELEVPNEVGLAPVKTAPLTVRAVATEDEALMIAVTERAQDVAERLAQRRFSQDRLDTALNLACSPNGPRNSDDPATVRALLAAGAQPNAAIHQAAQSAPRCLALLIAAHADVHLDIARTPGALLSYTGEGPRFKVGFEGPPLLYAVRSRNIETARLLLEAGADPNQRFGIMSPYAESHSPRMGEDEKTLALRRMMEARGGSRTLAQRALGGTQRAGGVAAAGVYLGACLVSALFGGQCH